MKIAMQLILSLACAGLVDAADAVSYTLPITRDGRETTRVAYPFWSGEYPSPVIDVNSARKGTTRIKAYKSLRKLDTPVDCTIRNGLYHPWAKNEVSTIDYYTLVPLVEYLSLKNQELGGVSIKIHDKISEVHYLAEGICEARVAGGKDRVDFECNSLDDTSNYKPLRGQENKFAEQWLYVKCAENYEAFVEDRALLKQKGITEGEIKGYGEVKSR